MCHYWIQDSVIHARTGHSCSDWLYRLVYRAVSTGVPGCIDGYRVTATSTGTGTGSQGLDTGTGSLGLDTGSHGPVLLGIPSQAPPHRTHRHYRPRPPGHTHRRFWDSEGGRVGRFSVRESGLVGRADSQSNQTWLNQSNLAQSIKPGLTSINLASLNLSNLRVHFNLNSALIRH